MVDYLNKARSEVAEERARAIREAREAITKGQAKLSNYVAVVEAIGLIANYDMNCAIKNHFGGIAAREDALRHLSARVDLLTDMGSTAELDAIPKAALDYGLGEYAALDRRGNPAPFFMRFGAQDDEQIRAVLSHRYTPLDNIPVLDSLRGAIGLGAFGGALAAFACRHSADGFRLNFCGGETVVAENERLNLGLSISNSEIGTHSVSVAPFAYRGYCENGMIFGYRALGGDTRVRHLGGDPERLRAWFMESCGGALNRFDNIIGDVREAIGTPVEDPDKYIAGVDHWIGLSKEDREAIKLTANDERMDHGRAEFSVYDIVNGITARAKAKADERRDHFERIGAAIIEGIINPASPPRGRRVTDLEELYAISEN